MKVSAMLADGDGDGSSTACSGAATTASIPIPVVVGFQLNELTLDDLSCPKKQLLFTIVNCCLVLARLLYLHLTIQILLTGTKQSERIDRSVYLTGLPEWTIILILHEMSVHRSTSFKIGSSCNL